MIALLNKCIVKLKKIVKFISSVINTRYSLSSNKDKLLSETHSDAIVDVGRAENRSKL
jgi:hypothetical protein